MLQNWFEPPVKESAFGAHHSLKSRLSFAARSDLTDLNVLSNR